MPHGNISSHHNGRTITKQERGIIMKRVTQVFFAAALLFCLALAGIGEAAEGDSVVVQKEHGLIDWTQNYIEATGMAVAPKGSEGAQAKALARRGATVDLQRNLLEFLAGVQVDARTTMNDFMAEDRVRSEVHGLIRNIELLDGTWDGESYTISGRVKLPQLLVVVAPQCEEIQRKAPKPPAASKPSVSKGRYTGLVIDARHLPLAPSLSFRVVDTSGHEVYSIVNADQKFFMQSGLTAYFNNIEIAKGDLRVATNPIVTKAVRLSSDNYDIVIPNDAAARVRGSSYDFRRECKIIIVCK
jgi:hypothetical protein